MGYLTTITIHNDELHTFQKNPAEFAEALFDGIDRANRENKTVSIPFKNTIGYIDIHKSRHADDETLYVHTGNTTTSLNKYDEDFKDFAKKNPKLAMEFIKRAQRILTDSRKSIVTKI